MPNVLQNCLPALLALGGAFVVALLLLWFSPARLNVRRLFELHRCEHGGVQSLAFVLVLPIFMTITIFIVQISQLLVGMMVVNYASFAAARAASVWIPAHLDDDLEPTNVLFGVAPGESQDQGQYVMTVGIDPFGDSVKLGRIRMAGVMGCASVSPSRPAGLTPETPGAILAADTVRRVYPVMAPSAVTRATDGRLANKVAYADHNTYVVVEWRDTSDDTVDSPTYMPRGAPSLHPAYQPWGGVRNDAEVGWQDAVTVYVFHRYGLISSAGRLVSNRITGWDRVPQRVLAQLPSGWTDTTGNPSQPSVVTVGIATVTNEGLKSVRPFDQPRY